MKARILLAITCNIIACMAIGQGSSIQLAFSAENAGTYMQLDSIKIMNRSQGGDTVLFWPDTVFTLYYLGIKDLPGTPGSFKVNQNSPNPFQDQTTISIYIPEDDDVDIIVTDVLGRKILHSGRKLAKGLHSFRFIPPSGNIFLFTAYWRGIRSSVRMIQAGESSKAYPSLEYLAHAGGDLPGKFLKNSPAFLFTPGDLLLYIGYAGGEQSGILDVPEWSQNYLFQYATNIPCPGTPTVIYEGQTYNTVQIYSQCWLQENLNVGTMIQGNQEMTNNGIIEKHCYINMVDSCTKFGGLYQWNEMMQYTTTQGAQGICPDGWHIPTDEEWKVLEGSVDKQFGIGDPEWDRGAADRGSDAGANLKSSNSWYQGGNGIDLVDFTGLPGGYTFWNSFGGISKSAWFWTSTEVLINPSFSNERNLNYYSPRVMRYYGSIKTLSHSVRCLKDEY